MSTPVKPGVFLLLKKLSTKKKNIVVKIIRSSPSSESKNWFPDRGY